MRARMNAAVIDVLVLLIPLVGIDLLLSQAFPSLGFFEVSTRGNSGSSSTSVSLGASGFLLTIALTLSYFFVSEALYGRTIGKRRMGLCVISARGGAASIDGVSARTVFRLIDGLMFYLVGAFVALISGPRRQRLGDLAGRTVVVREEDAVGVSRRRAGLRIGIYPALWIGAVVVVVGLGLGSAVGANDRAIASLSSYVAAREHGSAMVACSLLSVDQQRELVARVTGDYQHATSAQCPKFVLDQSDASSVIDPNLAAFAAGPLHTERGPLGAVVIDSAEFPNISIVAIQEKGRTVLDARGLQKVSFVNQCAAFRELSPASCFCIYEWLRANHINPYGDTDYHPSASYADQVASTARARCVANPAALPS